MLELLLMGLLAQPIEEPVVPVLVIEDAATLSPEEPVDPSPIAARMFGRLDELLTTDLSWLEHEPVFEARTTLTMGVLYEATPAWSFSIEGRLRHRLVLRDGAPSGEEAVIADFTPELRRLQIVHRPACGPELQLGLGVVRWGRTTLARPMDLVSPEDWRDGPFAPIEERRLPVVAASARFALGAGQLEALYVPFFVAARVPLSGENAPLLPDSLATVSDLADVKGPRQDLVTSADLGLRLTQRLGDLDLGLSWLFRRDRIPGPAGHGRQHVVGLDLGARLGALGVVGEVALFSERRLVRPDGRSEAHFGLDWALEVRLQPAIFLDLVAGLSGRHTPEASGLYLDLARDLLAFDYALTLLLAFDGRLRLDAEGRVELTRPGQRVRLGLHGRASDSVELGLGLTLSAGAADSLSLPALYRETSHGWLELVFVF